MNGLIRAEWYKLRHSKLFYILLIVIACAAAFFVGVVGFLDSNPMAQGEAVAVGDVFAFPAAGQSGVFLLGELSVMISICLAAFIGLFIANDFKTGTIRHALALGKKRTAVFFSKLFSAGVATLAFLLTATIVSTVGLTLLFDFGTLPFPEYLIQLFSTLSLQLLLHFTYAVLFCLIAFLSRNTGQTIFTGIGYVLVSSVLLSILGSFDTFGSVAKILPQYYAAALGNFPDEMTSLTVGAITVSVVYSVAAIWVGNSMFKKVDVK
ncbi:MAG: ABC transporter permease [Bacteroidales bacterium]|jgi:ABC-2 type transport system permease protein|nr:ABC transporter permease [Bacteroidales bacterium]